MLDAEYVVVAGVAEGGAEVAPEGLAGAVAESYVVPRAFVASDRVSRRLVS